MTDSLSAVELDRGTNEYRGHYGSFSMEAQGTLVGEYRLALRAATIAEPSTADILGSSATIVRALSTTPINVFMSFHMDTDLFDATTDWTQSPNKGASDGSLSNARVNTAVLQRGTAYTLYAVKADGSDDRVHKLLEFTTDSTVPSAGGISGMPQVVHTIRNGEPFLLQAAAQCLTTIEFFMDSSFLVSISFTYSERVRVAIAAGSVRGEIFYSSDVAKNEYVMLTKSMETGIAADKSAGENVVIKMRCGAPSGSSTFVIQ